MYSLKIVKVEDTTTYIVHVLPNENSDEANRFLEFKKKLNSVGSKAPFVGYGQVPEDKNILVQHRKYEGWLRGSVLGNFAQSMEGQSLFVYLDDYGHSVRVLNKFARVAPDSLFFEFPKQGKTFNLLGIVTKTPSKGPLMVWDKESTEFVSKLLEDQPIVKADLLNEATDSDGLINGEIFVRYNGTERKLSQLLIEEGFGILPKDEVEKHCESEDRSSVETSNFSESPHSSTFQKQDDIPTDELSNEQPGTFKEESKPRSLQPTFQCTYGRGKPISTELLQRTNVFNKMYGRGKSLSTISTPGYAYDSSSETSPNLEKTKKTRFADSITSTFEELKIVESRDDSLPSTSKEYPKPMYTPYPYLPSFKNIHVPKQSYEDLPNKASSRQPESFKAETESFEPTSQHTSGQKTHTLTEMIYRMKIFNKRCNKGKYALPEYSPSPEQTEFSDETHSTISEQISFYSSFKDGSLTVTSKDFSKHTKFSLPKLPSLMSQSQKQDEDVATFQISSVQKTHSLTECIRRMKLYNQRVSEPKPVVPIAPLDDSNSSSLESNPSSDLTFLSDSTTSTVEEVKILKSRIPLFCRQTETTISVEFEVIISIESSWELKVNATTLQFKIHEKSIFLELLFTVDSCSAQISFPGNRFLVVLTKCKKQFWSQLTKPKDPPVDQFQDSDEDTL